MRLPVLALPVPIGPARDAESEPLGDAREPLLDGGGVTGMADLDAVESLVLKDADLRLRPTIAQMRRGGESAHVVHQIRHVGELGEGLLDVSGTATAEGAAKCVAGVVASAAAHQRARQRRPATRRAPPARTSCPP